jgi:hypothetical protein
MKLTYTSHTKEYIWIDGMNTGLLTSISSREQIVIVYAACMQGVKNGLILNAYFILKSVMSYV